MRKSEFIGIFEEDLFLVGQKARSKAAALEDLVDYLFSKKRVNNQQAVLNTILAREKMGAAYRRLVKRERSRSAAALPGESPHFAEAAAVLANRGFDAVVFGHTHQHGQLSLADAKTYYNTGSWLHAPHYLRIRDGETELLPWTE